MGLNPVVDRGMGSTLGTSSVSKLDYALRLCAIPETLTGVTLPVLLSHWAKISASESNAEDAQQLQRSVWQGVIALLILMVPFLAAFYLFRSDIVAVLYGHGAIIGGRTSPYRFTARHLPIGNASAFNQQIAHPRAPRTSSTSDCFHGNAHQAHPESVSQLVFHAILGLRGDCLVNRLVVLPDFCLYCGCVLATEMNRD